MRFPNSQSCCCYSRIVLLVVILIFVISFAGCGGSSKQPVSPVSITVSDASVTLATAETHTFSATVSNAANTGVAWKVQEGDSGGTITASGTYTAPTTAGTYHVVATSQQDTTKSASSTVTVRAVGVTITPDSPTVAASATQSFTANVTNTSNTAVSWTVQESTTGGTISDAGIYKAPILAGTYHIVATSKADKTKFATTAVTVTSTPPAFTSTPPANANEGDVYSYTINAENVDNPDGTVTLALTDAPEGATLDGNVLTWTPARSQSRVANDFTVTATTSEGKQNTQAWTVSPTGTIHIVQRYIYASTTGTTTLSPNLEAAGFRILVLDSAGATSEYTGSSPYNGAYEIPGVPAGYYLLPGGYDVGLWTDQSDIDLSSVAIGRTDAQYDSSTNREYIFSGLDAWNPDNHHIELYVSNINQSANWTGAEFDSGITSVDRQSELGQMLAVASKGDLGIANQLEFHYADPVRYHSIVKSTGPLSITDTAGSRTTVNVPMSAPTKTIDVGLVFNLSEFAAAGPANGSYASSGITGFAYPYDLSKGYSYLPFMDIFTLFYVSGLGDVDLGSHSMGNPYPDSWKVLFSFYADFAVPIKAPGATTSTPFYVEFRQETDVVPTSDAPIRPNVGTVKTATIDGKDLFADQTGISQTPTLKWDAPTVGSANGYEIELLAFYEDGDISGRALTVRTAATQMTVPAGILETGTSYAAKITAFACPGADYAKAPKILSLPCSKAPTISGVFTTAGSAPGSNNHSKKTSQPYEAQQRPVQPGSRELLK